MDDLIMISHAFTKEISKKTRRVPRSYHMDELNITLHAYMKEMKKKDTFGSIVVRPSI